MTAGPTGATAGGLAAVVRRGDLRLRRGAQVRRLAPTPFDAELLAVVDAASAARAPLALVVPLPAADAPVMLGAASLTAEIVRSWSVAASATVVSSQLSQRTLYDQLCVRDSALSAVIPRARLDGDGGVVPVGDPYPGSGGGRMILTGDVDRVPEFGGGLVVDGTGGGAGEIGRLLSSRRALVYITDNPFDAAVAQIRDADGVVWAFDPPTLGQLAGAPAVQPAVVAPSPLLRTAGAAHRQVLAPPADTGLDAALHAAWSALAALPAGNGVAAAAALRWAWGVYATFALLATTPADYDRHVLPGPYSTRLADAAGHARAIADGSAPGARSAWLDVAGAFTDLLRAAAPAVKLPLVEQWLADVVDRGRAGLVVVRNSAAVEALTDALQASPGTPFGWQARVRVVGLRDLLMGRVADLPVDELLVTGPVPRAYGSLAAAPVGARATVLAAGGWEAGRAARQVTGTLRALADLRRETLQVSAPALGVSVAGPVTDPPPVLICRDGATLPVPEDDASPWEPFTFDVLAVLARLRGGRDDAPDLGPPARDEDGIDVPALAITFRGGQGLLMPPNDPIYRRSGEQVGKVAAKALVPGDDVALVDAASRRDLFDTAIAALAEVDTDYQLLQVMAQVWHRRVDAARGSDLTHREILARMRSGPDPTAITSETTIGAWLGHHAVPLRAADVSRFAAAVGDAELRRSGAAVGAALLALRELHQKVGRRLSAQITGTLLRAEETLMDPKFGVQAADLLEAVTTHQVEDVATGLVLVPAALAGLLLDADTFAAVRAEAQPA
ncbi:hypothetical protein GB931_17010 [Modestobacter sp. I12A-02628]|uniref:DISARM protein DrmE C-terminal domain-containing protein n=1 Tax=Goekera deserti TaxID=2497753 RepID=A0A7K3WGM7_9ACTN|nr:hypothetical protein [Goekera deserti]MPQ99585.1 hypothetical protein [Goekera deserti]NDI46404.1 hypothetical protein [Goekera deserti]NEL54663.1 hypothetical protein [Goekera deserti]